MKTKNLSLFIVSAFTFMLFMNFASAAVFDLVKVSAPVSVANNASTFNVVYNVTYTGALASITVNFSGSNITLGTATISIPGEITLNKDETRQLTSTVTFTSGQTGYINGNIYATPASGTPISFPFSVQLLTSTVPPADEFNFCTYDDGVSENPGDLRVKISDITVTGFGDDNQWLPFDEVNVEVTVQNKGNDNVDDISVEWGLYDTDTDDWVIQPDEIDSVSINDGDDEILTFSFTLDDNMDEDLVDLNDGKNYVLYVRATGDVDNTNTDPTCASVSKDIELVIEKDFVILNNFDFPETVQCGADVQISADVWNIGSRDQDSITVGIINKELKIDQTFDIGDINSFDNENLDATIKIPQNAAEKTYTLLFEVYDEDGNVFEGDFDNQQSQFTQLIKVEGSCSTSVTPASSKPSVSAELVSGSQAGKELVVKGTIKNNGDKSATYIVSATGQSEWGKIVSVQPSTITLLPGKSTDVLFTFTVNKGISGDQTFNIQVLSGSEAVADQPVSVTIEPGASGIAEMLGDNWYIWLIGLLNLILVIVIIIVAVRVAKK